MKTLFCLLLILSAFTLKAQEEPVLLKTPSGDISGTLALPVKMGKAPVVLLIAGSGPTDRNGNNPQMRNNSLKLIAENLQRHNIASLRFDKRGIAASQDAGKKEHDLLFDDYVDDAEKWIKLLAADKRFSRIIIAGHSEGSLIGILASIGNPAVSQYISIAGGGFPASKILKKQLASQPEPLKKIMYDMIGKLEKGDTIANVSPLLYSLFRPSVQPYMISWFKYDPAKEISKLKIPTLILQGTTDIQVKQEDAEALATAAPKAEKAIIEDMNHVLKECRETDMNAQMIFYTTPDIPLHPDLMKTIIKFIEDAK